MKNYDRAIERLETEMKALKGDLKNAAKATQVFLNECGNAGITTVSVGKRTEKIPRSMEFPFGPSGSVFSDTRDTSTGSSWPAIWEVVQRLGISGGCGNSDQHSVSGDDLIEGVYELKKGTWRRVE